MRWDCARDATRINDNVKKRFFTKTYHFCTSVVIEAVKASTLTLADTENLVALKSVR